MDIDEVIKKLYHATKQRTFCFRIGTRCVATLLLNDTSAYGKTIEKYRAGKWKLTETGLLELGGGYKYLNTYIHALRSLLVFGKCSPCSTLYSTTELCWVGRIIGSQPKPWVVLSAGNFWEGNDSLRTSSLMNALRSGVFKLKSIFYFPWRNLIATETTEPGAWCLVFIRQSRTKYNLLKERLRQHHEEARATRPIVISQLHTGYSLSKRTLVF